MLTFLFKVLISAKSCWDKKITKEKHCMEKDTLVKR